MKTISYKPLFKMLVDRDISKAQLRDMCGYSTAVATKLNKGEMVSLGVLVAICTALTATYRMCSLWSPYPSKVRFMGPTIV